MKYCSNCGKEVNENADFCLNCGKLLNNNKQQVKQKGKLPIWVFVIILLGALVFLFFAISFFFAVIEEIDNQDDPYYNHYNDLPIAKAYNVGEDISYEGMRFKVLDVERKVDDLEKDYAQIEVYIKNNNNNKPKIYNGEYFKLENSENEEIGIYQKPTNIDEEITFGYLFKDEEITGTLTYEIPKTLEDAYLVYYDSIMSNIPKFTVDLNDF